MPKFMLIEAIQEEVNRRLDALLLTTEHSGAFRVLPVLRIHAYT